MAAFYHSMAAMISDISEVYGSGQPVIERIDFLVPSQSGCTYIYYCSARNCSHLSSVNKNLTTVNSMNFTVLTYKIELIH